LLVAEAQDNREEIAIASRFAAQGFAINRRGSGPALRWQRGRVINAAFQRQPNRPAAIQF